MGFHIVLLFLFVLEYYWKSIGLILYYSFLYWNTIGKVIGLLLFYISFCIGKVLD